MLSKHFGASSNPGNAPFRPTPLAAMPGHGAPPIPPMHSAAADYASWLCRPMAGYLPLNPSNLLAARLAGKYNQRKKHFFFINCIFTLSR